MGCTNDHIASEQVPPASHQGMIAPRKNNKLDEATMECAITKCYKKLLYPQLAVWLGAQLEENQHEKNTWSVEPAKLLLKSGILYRLALWSILRIKQDDQNGVNTLKLQKQAFTELKETPKFKKFQEQYTEILSSMMQKLGLSNVPKLQPFEEEFTSILGGQKPLILLVTQELNEITNIIRERFSKKNDCFLSLFYVILLWEPIWEHAKSSCMHIVEPWWKTYRRHRGESTGSLSSDNLTFSKLKNIALNHSIVFKFNADYMGPFNVAYPKLIAQLNRPSADLEEVTFDLVEPIIPTNLTQPRSVGVQP